MRQQSSPARNTLLIEIAILIHHLPEINTCYRQIHWARPSPTWLATHWGCNPNLLGPRSIKNLIRGRHLPSEDIHMEHTPGWHFRRC